MATRKLSVVMIVRDAEDCLAATLDSVRNLADEIVVLDYGSHDGTIRIARQKATLVVSHDWANDLSALRNSALSAATGDWILWLEAGETLTAEASAALRRLLDHEADPNSAYYLMIRTPAEGANIAGEQVARIRLHPHLPGVRFSGRVRESLAQALAQQSIATVGLEHVIRRSARSRDADLRRARAERNLRLAQQVIQEEGPSARMLNCQGEAAQALGDAATAAQLHQQALDVATPGSSDMLEAYYGLLTALEGEPGGRDAQLQLCMKALETFPLDAQLLCAIGGYLQSKELYELASRAYQLSAEHGQLDLQIWHLEGLREITVGCHATTLQLMGRDQEAIELLDRELAADSTAGRLRRQLLELHVQHGRRDEALGLVNNMPAKLSTNRDALRSAVRGACLTATGNWISGKTYLETAYKAGCREPFCLRWLASSYLSAGNPQDAARVIEQWGCIDPWSVELRSLRQRAVEATMPSPQREVRLDVATGTKVPSPRTESLVRAERT